MARTPRPVDPAEGPVQAFAHDLRVLREQAGNPTYRALAKTAGFSATTLGDAAGGVRLPTLEVTLAYVGACGGDTEAWRARWQELSRQLAAERRVAEPEVKSGGEDDARTGDSASGDSDTGIANTVRVSDAAAAATDINAISRAGEDPEIPETGVIEEPESESETIGLPPFRHKLRRPALAAAAALVIIVALVIWRLPVLEHTNGTPVAAGPASSVSTSAPPAGCPKFAATPGTFTARTYEDATHVRTGASTDATVSEELPAGCTLRFTGYCLGEVVVSNYSASPDMRWFELSGGGLISSAIVHGSQPAGMAPSACPGDVPPPSSIELSAVPGTGGTDLVTLQASGKLVWIVGFAAYYPGAPGETAQWHQLVMTDRGTPYFSATLDLDAANPGSGTAGIPVVADACLGGVAPTAVFAAGSVDPAHPAALQPMTLAAADLAAAEQEACRYPATD